MTEDAWQTIRDSLMEAAMLQQDVAAGRLTVLQLGVRLDALASETVKRITPAEPRGGFEAARGILPWREGDELPEVRIRRARDAWDARLRDLMAPSVDEREP